MIQGANDNDAGNNHHDNSDDIFHFNFNLDYSQIIQVNLLFSGPDRFFLLMLIENLGTSSFL
jgi:hypothetical protein